MEEAGVDSLPLPAPDLQTDKDHHKHACNAVKRARAEFGAREDARRSVWGPVDGVSPGLSAALVAGSGLPAHLRTTFTLAPPLSPRLALVDALLAHFPTHLVAVQTSLATLLDMLQPSRSQADPLGVRNLVPALFLRMGRDQEAYDFVKWWAVAGKGDGYVGRSPASKANCTLDEAVSAADALEQPRWWLDNRTNLSHAAAVMLLKIRAHQALVQLQNAARALDCCLPKEIVDMVRAELLAGTGSVVVARRDLVIGGRDHVAEAIVAIKGQIWQLYRAIKKANKHFWPAMLTPEGALEKRPTSYSNGSDPGGRSTVECSYRAWKETPGALCILWKLCRGPVARTSQCLKS